ncbi:MAG: hypothetical protein RLZZ416_503 [Candidatus Parcubacteria bacterium]|jgi:shikimate kinase
MPVILNGENLFVIGPSCGGKTCHFRRVAEAMKLPFRDTDKDVEANAGMEISEIFAQKGEKKFRELETHALVQACGPGSKVVATGAGIVMDDYNRRLMCSGTIVWLDVALEIVLERQKHKFDRPNARTTDGTFDADKIAYLYRQRYPVYESLAHYRVHVAREAPKEEIAAKIFKELDILFVK